MTRDKRRPGPPAVVWVPALVILAVAAYLAPDWPRLWLFDLYQRLAPAHRDPSGITIIDVDAESVRQVGQWPWPRDRLARIVDRARNARVIGVDVLFLEPDRAPGDTDARLADAAAKARVVLAATSEAGAGTVTISVPPILQAGQDALAFLPKLSDLAWPLPGLARAARGTGLALIQPERDGVIRRLPTLYADGATLLPSFALEVLRVAEGERPLRVSASAAGVQHVTIGRRQVGTDASGAIWPHFARGVPARTIAAARVLAGDVDPAWLDGRIVLIGSSLTGLGDIHLDPLRQAETGTAINAQLIASVLAGDTLWRPALAMAGEVAALLGLGIASLGLFGRIAWRRQLVLAGGVSVLLVAASVTAFAARGMLLDWTLPVAGLVVVNAGLGAVRAREDRRARRQAETRLAAALDDVEQARSIVTQALNSTKLATLGEMASVLAHELRQPIATMSMAAENAEAALQDGSLDVGDARRRIDRILVQARRAESMIEHLGVFARADPGDPAPVDLAAAVDDALKLIEPSLRRHGIDLELRSAPDLPPVRAVKVLIEQVVINLCINARDALERERTIQTSGDTASGHRALAEGGAGRRAIRLSIAAHGETVRLEVADTGPGIQAGAMARLFEPFFTTKPVGMGTGLGLSVCRRIVESFGGTIAAENGAAGGAVFVVTLPVFSPGI